MAITKLQTIFSEESALSTKVPSANQFYKISASKFFSAVWAISKTKQQSFVFLLKNLGF